MDRFLTDNNTLKNTAGLMVIDRIPNATFHLAKYEIPGVAVNPVAMQTPYGIVKRPGEKLMFDPLNVDIHVSGNWGSYMEVQKWLRGSAVNTGLYPQRLDRIREGLTEVSSAVMTILDSLKKPIHAVYFEELFPVRIGTLTLVNNEEESLLTCPVTFEFTAYRLEIDKQG